MNWSAVSTPECRFFNRDNEQRLIVEALDDLFRHGTEKKTVLFWYGVPMVGKTTLLRQYQQVAFGRGIPVALVDFDREKVADEGRIGDRYIGQEGKVWLLNDVMARLVKATSISPSQWISPTTDDASTAATKLIGYIERLYSSLRKPVVLLFDTLDDASPETFAWFQENTLAPLLERRCILVALTAWPDYLKSQDHLTWPVLRNMHSQRMKPFDPQLSREQVQSYGESRWSSHTNLIEFTGGLPGLNEQAIGAKVDTEHDLLQFLVGVVFERLRHRNVETVRDELLAVSVFRQFDTELLRYTAETLWPEYYPAMDRRAARDLLSRLRKTKLVEQHPDGYGYVVPHDIRRVFDAYQRARNLRRHFEIHCLAARWFRAAGETDDPVFIADEVYHLAGMWRDANDGRFDIPLGLSEGRERMAQLTKRLLAGLDRSQGGLHKNELREKIKSILSGDEFCWSLAQHEAADLVNLCDRVLGDGP